MTGRSATQTPSRGPTRIPKSLAVLILLVGVVLFSLGLSFGQAQNPKDEKGGEKGDPKPPVPPVLAKLDVAINKDRAIFQGRLDAKGVRIPNTGIVDFRGMAAETVDAAKKGPPEYVNSDEYQAWTDVVLHAKQFPNSVLEEYAVRDLTRDDLTVVANGVPRFTQNRLDLVRLEGKLTRVRRLEASQDLKRHGTEEYYEALLVPVDEPMPAEWVKTLSSSVSVVFTELPAALAEVKKKPVNDWLEVDSWAAAAGYFFKVKQDAPGDPSMPVLVGKSVTLLKGEPLATGDNPAALDPNLRVFRLIRNDETLAPGEDDWEEVSAWNRVLLHARRFSVKDLEKDAREIPFVALFRDGLRDIEVRGSKSFDYKGPREYKLDLVKFEGWLIMLEKIKGTEKLRAAGIETAYEGWVVPKDESRGYPICVVFTDPPEGIEPNKPVHRWVSFAGYSFKLMKYKSQERDAKDPSRPVMKRAPLLLGRGLVPLPDPTGQPVAWSDFVLVAVAVVVGLVGFAVGVGWWFRRGDRLAKREIEAHRSKNPFEDQPT
jgi:hypothetical protein